MLLRNEINLKTNTVHIITNCDTFCECNEQSAPRASVWKEVGKMFQADVIMCIKSLRQEQALHIDSTERYSVQLKPCDQGRGPGRSDEPGRGQVTYGLVGWGNELEFGA